MLKLRLKMRGMDVVDLGSCLRMVGPWDDVVRLWDDLVGPWDDLGMWDDLGTTWTFGRPRGTLGRPV